MEVIFLIIAIVANVVVGYFAASKVAKDFELGDYESYRIIMAVVGLGVIVGLLLYGGIAKNGDALSIFLAILANVGLALGLAGFNWIVCYLEAKYRKG